MRHRAEAAERIRQLAAEIRAAGTDQPALAGSGRGLVVVAGGARIFTNAYVLLHMLRHVLGSSLPVELWYFGQGEVSPAMAALVEPLGVRLVDATPLITSSGAAIRDGWQMKSFALVHSGFAEVLLLDADQVPISDPAACFEWPQYRETGAVFWPDIIDIRAENPIWDLLGLEPRREASFESGQILVDRTRHAAALKAALKLNEGADDVYELIYGDKDTFLLAWTMLGAPHALVPHRPYSDEYLLVQRDFDGHALFQHRTNAKWQYGGEQRRLSGFRHEAECIAALAELEARWSGRVFTPPDRSAQARAVEQQLIDCGPLVLDAQGEPPFTIALAPHGEVREGRGPDRRHWWVETEAGVARLILSSGDQPNYVLERGHDNLWRGRRHRLPVVEVSLMGVARGPAAPAFRPDCPGLVDDLLRAAGVPGGEGYSEARLADALTLLAEVIPGVRARLAHLAATESDGAVARRLQGLLDDLGQPVRARQIDRTLNLEAGYVRADDLS